MTFSYAHKRTIFFVANTSWYLYNFRLPLLKKLANNGHEVFALAPFDSYAKHFKQYGIRYLHIPIARSGINPIKDLALLIKFVNIYRQYKPYIIQHFTPKPVIYGTLAARISGVKYIFSMISGLGYVFTGTSFKKYWIQKIMRFLYKWAMVFSRHVFFQNCEDRDFFIEHKLINKQKTSIIYGTGVNTTKFSPRKQVKRTSITFILVARMLWDKGIKEYTTVAYALRRKYRNIDFVLVGPVDRAYPNSISLEQLEQWNQEGVVRYFGMTDNIKSYLRKADVIVLPSYREGLPLSLLEGAAMGMPIITTDTIGCREIAEHGKNGLLVPIQDTKRLYWAMEKFITSPSLIHTMGKESRKIALQKFDSSKIVKQILHFYPI